LQMRDLVLNLLEISRLESGMKMNLETLDLKEVLEDTATELQDQVQAKRHNLELKLCNGQIPIQGDRILLQQLVRNLLGNAIKYTPENGQITLSANIEDDHVLVKFQDTGVGIPSEDLPHIFEKFFRVRTDETRDIEGTGLGLAIVISIVENHNGTIEVHSVVGKGSSFDVRLPLHLPA
jgi:signal transduction histidine kinase